MSDPVPDGAVAVDDPEGPVVSRDDTPEEAVDSITYLPSGKVRFQIEGRPYTLRSPKVREYRRLYAMWTERDEATKLTYEEQFDRQEAWVRQLFNGDPNVDPPIAGLSDHPLPDTSEWPAWVATARYQANVMVHFRNVPLALGGPTKTTP